MTKSNNKYIIKVSDYFDNLSDSRWKKFKGLVLKSIEKLPDFIQDVIGIDLDDPLKSLKEKFGSNKKRSKIPESDSKITSSFLPSANILLGGLFALSGLSTLAFFSPSVFLLVVLPIIGIIKVNNLISSDKEKEGTIHKPIRSRSEDYTKPKTRTVTYNEVTNDSNYASKIKSERDRGGVINGKGL